MGTSGVNQLASVFCEQQKQNLYFNKHYFKAFCIGIRIDDCKKKGHLVKKVKLPGTVLQYPLVFISISKLF